MYTMTEEQREDILSDLRYVQELLKQALIEYEETKEDNIKIDEGLSNTIK